MTLLHACAVDVDGDGDIAEVPQGVHACFEMQASSEVAALVHAQTSADSAAKSVMAATDAAVVARRRAEGIKRAQVHIAQTRQQTLELQAIMSAASCLDNATARPGAPSKRTQGSTGMFHACLVFSQHNVKFLCFMCHFSSRLLAPWIRCHSHCQYCMKVA